MRTWIHFAAALILLTLYGGQVCPLIDGLNLMHWGFLVGTAMSVLVFARTRLAPRLVGSVPPYDQPARQFQLDFTLFAACGVILSLYNTLHLGFPIHESGPKVVLGFLTFGFFVALDLALAREYRCGQIVLARDIPPSGTVRYTSLTRKFSIFALATIGLAGTVLILAVVKDVYWLSAIDMQREGQRAQLLIVVEIGFILLVLAGYILTIILSYTRNIRFFFGTETEILRRVRQGDLSGRVPAMTRDEFAEIADHTNVMIDGLEERERVKKLLGKAVSPTIAARLIEQDRHGISLGGAHQRLVILFSDIRGFTSRAESDPPETVIADLNLWFTEAVAAIQAHGGVVDKFIGDGILAVFGLDGDSAACEKAVQCAQEMQQRLAGLSDVLSHPMSVGIGIHKGEVLAGIVGSPERLEFTVVGDVVNTAARIEGLTRELRAAILVSEAVHRDITDPLPGWTEFGTHPLKGKARPLALFGVPMTPGP